MENEEDAASAAEPDATASGDTRMSVTEKRLRRLTGRSAAYRGQIVAMSRGWVSRDGNMHIFAARFLDFAVLTPEHLVLCSTGFFSRLPRRRVFREPLSRLVVHPRGPEPIRALRIVGDFDRPILLELRGDALSLVFAQELLARTRHETPSGPLSNLSPEAKEDIAADQAIEPPAAP